MKQSKTSFGNIPTVKKIAVIISQMEEACQSLIWDGIYQTAQKKGVTVVAFPALSGNSIISHYPLIADFINGGNFTDVILFSGAMSEYTNWSVVERYVDTIELPVVSIGGMLKNAQSSIVVDNKDGIIQLVSHLAQHHEKKRIGFLKGPESNDEALERLDAYIAGLKENHLSYDSSIIFQGSFSAESGRDAARTIVKRNISLDALVCADDESAIGAIKEFQRHNIHPPTDIIVTGFDDVPQAEMFSPSLTTVRQPFYEMGVAAVEAVLNHGGRSVIVKPTIFVPRNSCGCIHHSVQEFRKTLPRMDNDTPPSPARIVATLEPVIKESLKTMRYYSAESITTYRHFLENAIKKYIMTFLAP
ncbi:LacI family DNA-binding transcriptional regulator [Chitinivibrio alkaliphilus]|uniref:Transcriptional regulator n=1 Tax=Chitinivibrio alkaliphilus ACht1 TaxID=1313304 RepID=U7DB28_9BACT|nr:substrate-binding domain-containing protein [Chitinivibrio alkaliphilus]ERP31615.1 transcriptional regulator [Chitinivibrio alkaliphilus ACht1]